MRGAAEAVGACCVPASGVLARLFLETWLRCSSQFMVSACLQQPAVRSTRNGTKVCNMPAPAELESLEPQTTVKIGRRSS